MLLAAQALYAANQVKPKARSFCHLLSHKATASGKITNAFAAAPPILFYLISPEADRMTEYTNKNIRLNITANLINYEILFYPRSVSKKASGEGG
jgi:hypothetical protein